MVSRTRVRGMVRVIYKGRNLILEYDHGVNKRRRDEECKGSHRNAGGLGGRCV